MFLIRTQKSLKQTDFISKKEFFGKFKAYVNSLGHSIISIQSQLEEIEDFKDKAGISLETFWKHKGKFRNEILKMEDVNLILEILSELLLKSNQSQQTEPLDLSDTSTVENEIKIIKEPNGEMFSNNGFELFEYILTELVKPKETKGRKSDLIYYYWEMHNNNPQYIHQRPAPFFNWFEKEYNETTGQLKTYYNVKTAQRIKDYSTALEWFKSKNK